MHNNVELVMARQEKVENLKEKADGLKDAVGDPGFASIQLSVSQTCTHSGVYLD